MMEQNKFDTLKQLQSYNFAAYDMLLYLDTHPDDKQAFTLFKSLAEKTKSLKTDYEKKFGPLTPYSVAVSDSFDWLGSPWPWEKEANE